MPQSPLIVRSLNPCLADKADTLPLNHPQLWEGAAAAQIDNFPWRRGNEPPPPKVEFACAWTPRHFYARFAVSAENSLLARHLQPQSPVCQDSCVECFLMPPGSPAYLNFEVNCVGTILACRCLPGRNFSPLPPNLLQLVETWTSLPQGTPITSPSPCPKEGYQVAIRVPWTLFAAAISPSPGAALPPSPGDIWSGNFYKCADASPCPHWGCWQPTGTARPDFHRPEAFGQLVFQGPQA